MAGQGVTSITSKFPRHNEDTGHRAAAQTHSLTQVLAHGSHIGPGVDDVDEDVVGARAHGPVTLRMARVACLGARLHSALN